MGKISKSLYKKENKNVLEKFARIFIANNLSNLLAMFGLDKKDNCPQNFFGLMSNIFVHLQAMKKHDSMRPIIRFTYVCMILFALTKSSRMLAYNPMEEEKKITYAEGLKGEDVNKIIKDSRGLMWIATNKGVNCYNGQTIVPFSIEGGSSVMQVWNIVELEDGSLIAGMDGGLYKIDFARTDCKRVFSEISSVNALCAISNHIVVGSDKGIYLCMPDGKVVHLSIESSVIAKSNQVNAVAVADDSTVWFCTNDRVGRLLLPALTLQMYDIDHDLYVGNLSTLCYVNNTLFAGTEGSGILRLSLNNERMYAEKYAITNNVVVNELTATGDSLLHVCADVFFTINVKSDSIITMRSYGTDSNTLPTNGVYTYYHDEELDVDWIGYFVEGLSHSYHTNPLFETYRIGDFDTRNINIRSFCIGEEHILIGTREGMYCIDKKQATVTYLSSKDLGASVVTNIVSWGGMFIVATYGGGLLTYDPYEGEVIRGSLPIEGNFSRLAVTPDSSRLVAVGNLGLYVIDRELQVIAHYDSRNSELPNAHIPDIHFDYTGKGWVGTLQGLAIYDPRTGTVQTSGFSDGYFHNESNLSFNQAFDGGVIAFSPDNVYLSRSDLSSYTALSLYTHPDVGTINFILPYADSLYWVGANKGLFLFNRELKQYMQFNESNGLSSLQFAKQEYARTADGTLWFATKRGLVYLTPEAQEQIHHPIEGSIAITELLIDGRQQDLGTLITLADDHRITLQWNFVSEQMVCTPMMMDYSFPGTRYYEYAVDGKQYEQTENGGRIILKRLQLGKHSLRIRVAGREETVTEFRVNVVPSLLFYFELLFLITLSIALYSIYKWNGNHRKLHIKMREKYELELRLIAEDAVRRHEQQQVSRLREEEEAKQRERDRRASSKEYKELYRKVKEYMELEKPYKRSAFSLFDLATAVGSSTTMLSLMFNQTAETTFYDFVAKHRIEEFKRMATNDKWNHLTVTAISERCGFKKSTFFAAFKRIEGCTPTEWLSKQMGRN